MIDAAKYADTVIFVIDVSYGFEMETLEFVNLLKVHGMPKVIGVFTHLDCFEYKARNEVRTSHFKKDFKNEIDEKAKLFCLSAPIEGVYEDPDIFELASFISGMEFHPTSWRAAHPYVLVDRFEDVTPTERLHMDKNCDRDIILYGYLRGCDIKKRIKVHIAGVVDLSFGGGITRLGEPRPLRHIDGTDLEMQIDITEHGIPDEETRFLKKEIFRIGSYLKFIVRNVPFEMFNNLDPCQPILVVGIGPEEQIVGRISARFERHGLHMKSLKSEGPIIVSVGWRRYRTKPIYALEDFREILKFTPEDKPCSAMFWGPFATPGTGVVALQSLADNRAAFRILATGEVLDFICASKTRLVTRKMNTFVEVPFFYNPLVTAPEPSNRIWKGDPKESETSEAHVVWASHERKIAPEDLRETMSKLHEKKLKFSSQRRKTTELRRAVIIVHRLSFGNEAELQRRTRNRRRRISVRKDPVG